MENILIALAFVAGLNIVVLGLALAIYLRSRREDADTASTPEGGRVTTKDLGGPGPWRPGTGTDK